MLDIDVSTVDSVWLNVQCERSIARELSDHFTFKVPGYKFMPAYRSKLWNGEIHLFNVHTQLIYCGLLDYVVKFAKDRDYTISVPARQQSNITQDMVTKFVEDFLQICVAGKPVKPHPHQIFAILRALQSDRCLLLSPTGSGKSLIIYAIIRYYMDKIPPDKKIIILVPTISLVQQLFSDFCDYSFDNGWDVSKNCYKITAGESKSSSARIFISTWQSVYKQPEKYFDQFAAVFGDECHLFSAKSLTSIMTKLKKCPYRIGTTGTLDGSKTNRLVLEGLFGRVFEVTKTKDLMEKKILSDLTIDCLVLKYPPSDRELMKRAKYQDEIKWLIGSKQRNQFITGLCGKLKGNTLVLFQFVEGHGQGLHKLITDTVDSSRKVFFVYGGTEACEREDIRKIVETQDNAIIIASYGTFSTGISIRRLHNIVFASPSKSRIRVLQSIGRQLRVSENKTIARLYDIGDDLSYKSWTNHTLRHMKERLKLYDGEGFVYKSVNIDIGDK